ncbi:MAG: APC family permease [Kofleriaceae bacterium]
MATNKLTLWTGLGLVISNMVGTGVLTTAGEMAPELSATHLLTAWLLGGIVALGGALAYAALARQVPRSGGEYRYLSSLLHPAIGYVAGWASLLVGFSVPVAIAAIAAGSYSETVIPGVPPKLVATASIVLITFLHALNFGASKWTQDVLATVKASLFIGFIAIGLTAGSHSFPVTPETEVSVATEFPIYAFFASMVPVMYCYSGWNAAIYASEEFAQPRRDVPRAMIIGCILVTTLYVLINAIIVMNLSHEEVVRWRTTDTAHITLAHVVMQNLIGRGTATVMSAFVVLSLLSAISAMTLIGPRVYAAMARDRLLPAVLGAKSGKPPLGSVIMQGSIAIVLVYVSTFRTLLNNVGAILAIISAVTVLSLLRRSRWRSGERPGIVALLGAVVFASMSTAMVYSAMKSSPKVSVAGLALPTSMLWIVGIVVISLVGFVVTRVFRPDAGRQRRRRGDDPETADFTDRRSGGRRSGDETALPTAKVVDEQRDERRGDR